MFVHVVQELDFGPQLRPNVLEELRNLFDVLGLVERDPAKTTVRAAALARFTESAPAVTSRVLNPDMSEAFLE